MLILLPPSAGKAAGGDPVARDPGAFPALEVYRREVLAALADPPAPDAPTLPALARYTGVVYTALDPAALGPAARRRAQRGVVVVSGLWGLVRAEDRLPAYRLAMGTLPPLGSLARWWRPRLRPVLAEVLAGCDVVYDLLPVAYAAAVDLGAAGRRLRRLELTRPGGGAAGHHGKQAKGRIARHLLEHPRADPDELDAIARQHGLRAALVRP